VTERCTCYLPGAHGEKPRKRVLPHKIVRLPGRSPSYLSPVETDDPRCPVHGIAGSKIKRTLRLASDEGEARDG
jgi:hypothetical protein